MSVMSQVVRYDTVVSTDRTGRDSLLSRPQRGKVLNMRITSMTISPARIDSQVI